VKGEPAEYYKQNEMSIDLFLHAADWRDAAT
jgi:hypothetical protein